MLHRAYHAFSWHDFNLKKGWFFGSDESGLFASPASMDGTRMLVFRPLEGAYGLHPAKLDAYAYSPFETTVQGIHANVKSKKRVYRHGGERDVVTLNLRESQSGRYRWISQPWTIQWRPGWECNSTTQDIVRVLIREGHYHRRAPSQISDNIHQSENGRFVSVVYQSITEETPLEPEAHNDRVDSLLDEYWRSAYGREGGSVVVTR